MFGVDAWIIWTILLVVLLVIESTTFNLTTIWFAIGALVALILSILGSPVWLQAVVFVVVSIALFVLFLFLIKPKIGSFINKPEATNADRIIGMEGVVMTAIDPGQATGLINVKGQTWSAMSADDQKIEEGTAVTVTEIKGVRAIVVPKVT